MEIGQRIKILRENKQMTQIDLAKVLKINNSTLSQYETGARVPSDDMKIAIADYFSVSLDYLLGRDKRKEPTPVSEDGPNEAAQVFMPLVDKLTPDQQQLLLAQLQAWTGQNERPAPAAPGSGGGKAPGSDS